MANRRRVHDPRASAGKEVRLLRQNFDGRDVNAGITENAGHFLVRSGRRGGAENARAELGGRATCGSYSRVAACSFGWSFPRPSKGTSRAENVSRGENGLRPFSPHAARAVTFQGDGDATAEDADPDASAIALSRAIKKASAMVSNVCLASAKAVTSSFKTH